MNNRYVIIFTFIFFFINCENIEKDDTNDSYDTYFPMNIGMKWFYNQNTSENNPYLKREITEKIQIENNKYFIISEIWRYNEDNPITYFDTLRQDNTDRIFKYSRGKEYLLYDFTLDSGDTYIDSSNSKYSELYYIVTYRDIDSVETDSGIYYDCIELLFDIPNMIDDEVWCTFAPGVGLIKRWSGEGPRFVLDSYDF